MATISIAAAVVDEPETHRKKLGDIIAVRPGGWQWGSSEVLNHLILEFDLPGALTWERVTRWLQAQHFDNDSFEFDPAFTVLGKRRFKVDWDRLQTRCQLLGITVDWDMVGNKAIAYQPLSAQEAAPGGETHLFDPILLIHDKFNNRIIRLVDLSNWSAG